MATAYKQWGAAERRIVTRPSETAHVETEPYSPGVAPRKNFPQVYKQALGSSITGRKSPLMKKTRTGEAHPAEDALLRFLRGAASQEERRAIVRHLLTGCPECVAVTRPVWKLMRSRRGEPMEDEVTAAHTELLLIIQDVETLRYRLLGVRASLPELEEPGDISTELRVRLRHIVGDRLHPLHEDLMAAAEYRNPGRNTAGEDEPPQEKTNSRK
jgi:hypothetical protein